jgi:hypothetical protein
LIDTNIKNFLDLLHAHFGKSVTGLEDTLILANFPQTVQKCSTYVRVLMSRECHWVCVRGVENEPYMCVLYDTMRRDVIDSQLGESIGGFSQVPANGDIRIRVANVQRQDGENCGYFACAIATALLFGHNPEEIVFDEKEMVDHFIDIYAKKAPFTMFPFKKKKFSKKSLILSYEYL